MSRVVNLADLKIGDEVPVDAVISEMFITVWPSDGPPSWIRLTNVPVSVMCSGEGL